MQVTAFMFEVILFKDLRFSRTHSVRIRLKFIKFRKA